MRPQCSGPDADRAQVFPPRKAIAFQRLAADPADRLQAAQAVIFGVCSQMGVEIGDVERIQPKPIVTRVAPGGSVGWFPI